MGFLPQHQEDEGSKPVQLECKSTPATPPLSRTSHRTVATDTSVCSFGHCHSSENRLGALRPPGRSQHVTVGKQVLHSITEKAKRGGARAWQLHVAVCEGGRAVHRQAATAHSDGEGLAEMGWAQTAWKPQQLGCCVLPVLTRVSSATHSPFPLGGPTDAPDKIHFSNTR